MAASISMTTFSIILNILSSISIVMLNKWIYTHYGFPNITLTFIHFIITFLGLKVCEAFNIFCPKRIQLRDSLPLAMSFCGFVVLTNLSLQHNTVGTYQLIKVLTTPCIMLIHTYMYGKKYSFPYLLTLVPIILGVFLNTYYDVQFNVLGVFFAGLGVVVTSFYQVWVGTTQKDLNINTMQLLNYQAPLSALLLLFVIPMFENVYGEKGLIHAWPLQTWIAVFASGLIAFSVNLTIFWIIGNTSPVTYNMVGHMKFCLVLIFGYLLFQAPLEINQLLGVCSTIFGVVMYSHLKLKDQQQQRKASVSRSV